MKTKRKNGVGLNFFTEDQCAKIVESAISVLEKTGCRVKNARAKEILGSAGCKVEGDIVKIPSSLMHDAIASVPKEVSLYDREGNLAVTLSAHSDSRYIAPGISSPHRVDLETGKSRPSVRADIVQAAVLEDNLENIDVACSMTSISDCDESVKDVVETALMIENTHKPFMINSFSPKSVEAEVEMLAAVRGSEEALREKPYVLGSQTAVSPLGHTEESLDTFMSLVEHGIPTVYLGAPSMGATGPITIAGCYVATLADCFLGLLLSQLIYRGYPFVACAFVDVMDMRTMMFSFSAPEFALNSMASAEIFR
ncbi:MAG: trimethylamine methyltransferase family protein, partial [Coriobacteriales bacterium]